MTQAYDPKQQFFKNTSWSMLKKSSWGKHLGGILEASGEHLGGIWKHLEGTEGVIWEASGNVWKHLGVISQPSGRDLGGNWETWAAKAVPS